jgi:hypothetical protein
VCKNLVLLLQCIEPNTLTHKRTHIYIFIIGLSLTQIIEKSKCIDQLYMRDHPNPRQSLLYKLSGAAAAAHRPSSSLPGLDLFKIVRLLASPQDGYVPLASAIAETDKAVVASIASVPRTPIKSILLSLSSLTATMSAASTSTATAAVSTPTPTLHTSCSSSTPSPVTTALSRNAWSEDARVYQEMIDAFESHVVMSGTTKVEKYLVVFGSVLHAGGWDLMKRRAHVAMLEDAVFTDMLVFIDRLHI